MKKELKEQLDNIIKSVDHMSNIITNNSIKETIQKTMVKENGVICHGAFNSHGTDSKFAYDFEVNELLSLDNMKVTKVLSALGNNERYAILKMLLEKPRSVNEIVKELKFETTGKAYHHLNALLASDLIFKNDNEYRIRAKHIGGLLTILAGTHSFVSDGRNTINLDSFEK